MEVKGRVQMIYGDQDRDLGSGDQRSKNTVSKEGNTQGYTEIGDEVRTRMRTRARARTRTRVRMRMRARWGQGRE